MDFLKIVAVFLLFFPLLAIADEGLSLNGYKYSFVSGEFSIKHATKQCPPKGIEDNGRISWEAIPSGSDLIPDCKELRELADQVGAPKTVWVRGQTHAGTENGFAMSYEIAANPKRIYQNYFNLETCKIERQKIYHNGLYTRDEDRHLDVTHGVLCRGRELQFAPGRGPRNLVPRVKLPPSGYNSPIEARFANQSCSASGLGFGAGWRLLTTDELKKACLNGLYERIRSNKNKPLAHRENAWIWTNDEGGGDPRYLNAVYFGSKEEFKCTELPLTAALSYAYSACTYAPFPRP